MHFQCTFHVNMLFTTMEEWLMERTCQYGKAITAASNSVFDEQLTSEQQQELQGLLNKLADVMQNQPGLTDVAEHTIDTGSTRPVKLPPHRLPHAHRETVQRKCWRPSQSEGSVPDVLIKKDSALRLCVQYQRLNSVSKSIPRIDDLIDQLDKAWYLTTLDLTKGY